MKKVLIVLAILVLGYVFISKKQDYYIIPDDSIRFRVIANSNSVYDKYVKIKVKESLEQSFYDDLSNSTSIEESRQIITNNIEDYKSIVQETLNDLSYDEGFTINYGLNYFPEKEYKGVIYEEGNYGSLVITIGKGEGENFWCVLFPPICTLEAEETDDIEYRFLIKDLFDKYILNK
ncbi:MAG: stage II sporulation protein R [bacterium]|nr:stage II sporulation protein R [bacterium]